MDSTSSHSTLPRGCEHLDQTSAPPRQPGSLPPHPLCAAPVSAISCRAWKWGLPGPAHLLTPSPDPGPSILAARPRSHLGVRH